MNHTWKKLALFAGGVLFGTAGIDILKSRENRVGPNLGPQASDLHRNYHPRPSGGPSRPPSGATCRQASPAPHKNPFIFSGLTS